MAGIYIHIPFCKTRCIYCDFYSTTRSELKTDYINALCHELTNRKDYLKGEPIETIYFGGGTPSQLNEKDFKKIFSTIAQVYGLEITKEITLEANPDDLTEEYAQMIATLPFNRISMGIQTFHDDTLQLLHRRHNSAQAIKAVGNCRKAGFQNISIDLIYGLPGETMEKWTDDLKQAIALNVEHISAYHLTYEENTPLHKMLIANSIREVDEDSSLQFFGLLTETLKKAGYQHYEISNFCKPEMYSKHNTAYWQGVAYLGCGASAHSFNKTSRQWNVSSITEYIERTNNGQRCFESETQDLYTQYNECIMTALRTMQGVSIEHIESKFGSQLHRYCMSIASKHIANSNLEIKDNHLRLTRKGIFVSDGIISDLMFVE